MSHSVEYPHLTRWSTNGPTAFDSAANYGGADLSDCYVVPGGGLTRDTQDSIAIANAKVIRDTLLPLLTHEESGVHSFGHWACGWYELLLIHESETAALEAAEELAAGLSDYPVIDDDVLSEVEREAEDETWANYIRSEFQTLIREETGFDISECDDGDMWQFCRDLCDRANIYWDHGNEGAWLDVHRLSDVLTTEETLARFPDAEVDLYQEEPFPTECRLYTAHKSASDPYGFDAVVFWDCVTGRWCITYFAGSDVFTDSLSRLKPSTVLKPKGNHE